MSRKDALETKIDKAITTLLERAPDDPETKLGDLTKLIEAATKWYETKHKLAESDGFGMALDGKKE